MSVDPVRYLKDNYSSMPNAQKEQWTKFLWIASGAIGDLESFDGAKALQNDDIATLAVRVDGVKRFSNCAQGEYKFSSFFLKASLPIFRKK